METGRSRMSSSAPDSDEQKGDDVQDETLDEQGTLKRGECMD